MTSPIDKPQIIVTLPPAPKFYPMERRNALTTQQILEVTKCLREKLEPESHQ